jgi:signal transduction histidine kinase
MTVDRLLAGLRLGGLLLFTTVATLTLAGAKSTSAAAPEPGRSPDVVTIHAADAVLEPVGRPAEHHAVALRHRWDAAFPGLSGRAVYTLQLPPVTSSRPMALLLERVANQATVRVDGVTVLQLGVPGDRWFDAGKSSQLIVLPQGLLRADQPNVMTVDATMQPMRFGGLWPVRFGPLEDVQPLQARLQLLEVTLSAAYAASLLLMGGLAAGLWWRQRDRTYGIFCLAAFFGVLRHLDRVWIGQFLPWPLSGATLAIFYCAHLTLIAYFSVLILGREIPWVARMIRGVMATTVLLAGLAFGLVAPALWTFALMLLATMGVLCLGVVFVEAFRRREAIAWLVAGTLAVLVTAGLHDLMILRLGLFGGSSIGLTPHAMMILVVLLAGLVVERYSRTVADYRGLNEHLAERIAERESQLREAFEAMRLQQEEQAVALERQRIMREIHDGIGSQLVGMLNMLGDEDDAEARVDRAGLEKEIRLALDEMRMAVDSLQPMDSDLAVVLATLRYRLQPRLEAARLDIVWDVEALPPIEALSPPSIFQLQRILLEAFTNVLRHARASRVVVQARWREAEPAGVVLRVSDNGIGPPIARPGVEMHGKGLASMRARARAIGAALRIEPSPGGGTSVVIDWPVGRRDDASMPATAGPADLPADPVADPHAQPAAARVATHDADALVVAARATSPLASLPPSPPGARLDAPVN